jgi:hypothetical protein
LLGFFGQQGDGLALGERLAQLDLVVHGQRLGPAMVDRTLVLQKAGVKGLESLYYDGKLGVSIHYLIIIGTLITGY